MSDRHGLDIESYHPEKDPDFTNLVLDQFCNSNKGKRVHFDDLGELDQNVLVSGIRRGIVMGEINWYWRDRAVMPTDEPLVHIIDKGKRSVEILTSTVWLDKCMPLFAETTRPRYRLFGVEVGRKVVEGVKDGRDTERIKKDNFKVVELVKSIYINYRLLG